MVEVCLRWTLFTDAIGAIRSNGSDFIRKNVKRSDFPPILGFILKIFGPHDHRGTPCDCSFGFDQRLRQLDQSHPSGGNQLVKIIPTGTDGHPHSIHSKLIAPTQIRSLALGCVWDTAVIGSCEDSSSRFAVIWTLR